MEERNKENVELENYYDKQPAFGNKGPSKIRRSFERGLTAFLVVAASVCFYFVLLRFKDISKIFSEIFNVAKPIIYGFAIAYLLNPIVRTVENALKPYIGKALPNEEKTQKAARSIGIIVALVILISVVVALCNMVIPELYVSIRDLIFALPSQLDKMNEWFDKVIKSDTTTGRILKDAMNQALGALEVWLKTDLLKQSNVLMVNLTAGVLSALNEVFNVLIGIIVSIYVLFSKETFSAQSKKALYALMQPAHANMTIHITRKSNEIFGGFIIGKIIDSVIIGVLCFIGLSILDMPYILLVSVIVGVTNVIPFFGPYIGAIPSAVLILLDDPKKGIYFIIFILFLQQLDGNVIGPKILGSSTGLSAFWVVFAILLGGGLFGFPGMLLGVPTFAVIYYIAEMLIEHKLQQRKLPTESEDYNDMNYVNERGKFVYNEPKTVQVKTAENNGNKKE